MIRGGQRRYGGDTHEFVGDAMAQVLCLVEPAYEMGPAFGALARFRSVAAAERLTTKGPPIRTGWSGCLGRLSACMVTVMLYHVTLARTDQPARIRERRARSHSGRRDPGRASSAYGAAGGRGDDDRRAWPDRPAG